MNTKGYNSCSGERSAPGSWCDLFKAVSHPGTFMSLRSRRREEGVGVGGGSSVGWPQRSLRWGWPSGQFRAEGVAAGLELSEEVPGDWRGGGNRS